MMSTPLSAETDLRYPIGRPDRTPALTPEQRTERVNALAAAPRDLRRVVDGLTDEQLDTPYRPGGWTVRQLVHHVADSHMNAYVRFRLALTEPDPVIRPYEEAEWATLSDAHTMPVEVSLTLLDAMHQRLVALLRDLPAASFARTLVHPESGAMTVDSLLNIYAWHGAHHTAHVSALRSRMRWT